MLVAKLIEDQPGRKMIVLGMTAKDVSVLETGKPLQFAGEAVGMDGIDFAIIVEVNAEMLEMAMRPFIGPDSIVRACDAADAVSKGALV